MPEWTAPFHAPRMTTAEFAKQKADYIAKHGYQITIPGFEDIVKIPIERPMTAQEEISWRAKDFDAFTEERYEELKYIKKRRKERYLAMLGDPTPEFLRTRAAVLGALDDAEDAMSTLAVAGMVLAKVLPRTMAKFVVAPVGWLMGATEILDMAMVMISPERLPLNRKRVQDQFTDPNPASKKARAKRLDKIKAARLTHGNAIEALQVTDQIFGAGLSLGQLMGLPIQILAGNALNLVGRRVRVKYPIPDFKHWVRAAQRVNLSLGTVWGVRHNTDDEQLTRMLLAQNLAAQVTHTYCSDWNPLDMVPFIEQVQMRPPAPTSILTLEILEEEDPEGLTKIGWPATGQEWSNMNDLGSATTEIATDNFRRYCDRNRHNWPGFIGATAAVDSLFYSVESLEGPGSMQYDYTAACKTIHGMLSQGYDLPQTLSPEKRDLFARWLIEHESLGTCPTTPEALSYAKESCGFEFERNYG